ncbi:hypothetical protein J4221_00285 [Candidatus Pacearchaeota archaeon]|nr:hypothetical protein [Candidatus Pacearchaeota archaeon]
MEKKSKLRIEKVEKIWIPDVKIYLPSKDGEIIFGYPPPNKYELDRKNFRLPSADQVVDLIYAAFFSKRNEPNLDLILDPCFFRIYNVNLWTNEGIYVEECSSDWSERYPSFNLEVGELEEKLTGGTVLSNGVRFSKDNKIRFAPRDSYTLDVPAKYAPSKNFPKFSEKELIEVLQAANNLESIARTLNPKDYVKVREEELKFFKTDLENDGFIIASFGIEGAKKLAEISKLKVFGTHHPRCFPISWESESDEYIKEVVNDSNYLRLQHPFAGYGFELIGSSYLYSGWRKIWKNHRERMGNDLVEGCKTFYVLKE